MIAQISRRWWLDELVRYLMGPGGHGNAPHVNQRGIATWDGVPELHQPVSDGSACGFEVRDLVDDLTDPALAGQVSLTPPAEVDGARRRRDPVWHCWVRNAPGDPLMSDAEWTEVVEELMDRTGIRGRDDPGGCHWVAIGRAGDQSTSPRCWSARTTVAGCTRATTTTEDYYRARDVCRDAERRLGLTSPPAVGEGAGRSRSRAAVAAGRTANGWS